VSIGIAVQGGRFASFRDPGGRLLEQEGRMLRLVWPEGLDSALLFLKSPALEAFRETGRVIDARVTPPEAAAVPGSMEASLVLEHPRMDFPNYPYEWAPEMLAEAGRLTLDLAEALLAEGLGLKDATPYNILFHGHRPVFVDALSVERREPLDPIWLPMAQFQRTFIFPLLARDLGMSLARSLGCRREGIEPEELARLAGPVLKWVPPYLPLATLPAVLGRNRRATRDSIYRARRAGSREEAVFILKHCFRQLRSQLENAARSNGTDSAWSDYQAGGCHYSPDDLCAKDLFVERALDHLGAGARVLDVGTNLGRYSRMAARRGLSVTAIDSDPVVVGRLWREASTSGEQVLPLVVDLAEPSPGTGWRNSEWKPFLERTQGWPDLVMLLAVVHHLVVTARVPLEEIVSLAAATTRAWVITELVEPGDPQFKRLCRGRDRLFERYGEAAWEQAWTRHFQIEERARLAGSGRVLYRLRLRG
jgi:SAM-dependent methyltransferase